MSKIVFLFALLLSFSLTAKEEVLTLDRVVPNNFELAFPNDDNIEPVLSDFKVKNAVLMSNELGERFAVVTIENRSSGSRTLNQKHLMAQVSNGERISPQAFSQTFNEGETLSLTINFGENKFPLLWEHSIHSNIT